MPEDDDTVAEIVLTLPPEPRSCTDARRAVGAFCRTHRLVQLIADAELLTAELVANAVEHAGTTITVHVSATESSLTVRVTDDNARPVIAAPRPPTDTTAGGRGLRVVDAVAGDWGTDHQPGGKSVWFRLP
jgi:phosphoserine phosphatase RsbU/P